MGDQPTLIVLAAGLGSRYGGLKQVDSFGPSGESLLDYTVYDAIKTGFGKIVFVIRESMADSFIPRIKNNFEGAIKLDFAYQDLDDLPEGFIKPEDREKPWGTAHAIWSARNVVSTPFCIVNADDFYGRPAFSEMHDLLVNMNNDQINGCLVGYKLKDTLSDYGSVSRGVCELEGGNLLSISEHHEIERQSDKIVGKFDGEMVELAENTVVSMNLMGFSSTVFSLIESEFRGFLNERMHEAKSEFYAPEILQTIIHKDIAIPVSVTNSEWFGVTYPDDKPLVQSNLKRLSDNGAYPDSLWVR